MDALNSWIVKTDDLSGVMPPEPKASPAREKSTRAVSPEAEYKSFVMECVPFEDSGLSDAKAALKRSIKQSKQIAR